MNNAEMIAKYDELVALQADLYSRARGAEGYAVVVGDRAVKVVLAGEGNNGYLAELRYASELDANRAAEIADNVGGVVVPCGMVWKAAADQLGLAAEIYRNVIEN